jgi:Uma2 family endonuclease
MVVALLQEPPLTPPGDLGPYRRWDYLELPDEPRCELIQGRIYVSPSPSVLHQLVVGWLFRFLLEIAEKTEGLAFCAPLDVFLAEHSVVQPDLFYVSPRRLGIVRERIEGAPNLLVEVLSPGSVRRDRGEKLLLYAEAGVEEYWLVDATERQIEFLVNRGGRFEVALPARGIYRSAILPEIVFDVAALWRNVKARLGPAAS